ncbi:DUF1127 domain-containing protein [Pseudomonas sp. CFBP 13719]|uniref:DUF1127 domain-containing protein n=1 Tax=Pseudomonas sp. CFBP 13719 TaxID=2775303 RepID=UPI001781B5F4|nr:hypothetical protein [Pseudomonas sp. CFBP 13719]MBD8684231.1 hypothetical protein [Pseudomonas sp. CFBP 13719]
MNGLTDVRLLLRTEELREEPRLRPCAERAPAELGRWALMLHHLRTRPALLELDKDQLRDIGLDVQQARSEGLKPFWRL